LEQENRQTYLGIGIGCASSSEGNLDEVLSENVIEHGGAESAIFTEDFVEYIPLNLLTNTWKSPSEEIDLQL